MAVKAHGRIVFWEGASLWVLGTRDGARYPRTAVHSHHALQVTLALRGQFTLVDRTRMVSGPAAAVAADTDHAFEADGVVAHLFVDPDGREGRAIAQRLFGRQKVVSIPSEDLSGLAAELLTAFEERKRKDGALIEYGRRLVTALAAADDGVTARSDPRVRKMISFAANELEGAVSLSDAAAHVGLSNGRARHLFVEETGLPFRVYLLWLRLTKAVEVYAAGESLTEAAHAAGFSDSAHLSRTFRRMFGISADSLRLM